MKQWNYNDILISLPFLKEFRHQITSTWELGSREFPSAPQKGNSNCIFLCV